MLRALACLSLVTCWACTGYRMPWCALAYRLGWRRFCRVSDAVFWFDRDHCERSADRWG